MFGVRLFDMDLTQGVHHPCKAVVVMKTHPLLLTGLLLASNAPAQQPVAAAGGRAGGDPFVRQPQPVQQQAQDNRPKHASICFETFSLDLADAAELRRKVMGDQKLYDEILTRVAKGQAVQESFSVLRSRSGEKALLENISEFIYPTEYEKASVPNSLRLTSSGGEAEKAGFPAVIAEATPTSFETRNTGLSLEIEPTLAQNDLIIDLRIAPNFTTLVEKSKFGKGASETEMPTFETQRIETSATVWAGRPFLLGTPSRPPVSKVDADSAKRVWFAFVTVDIIAVPE